MARSTRHTRQELVVNLIGQALYSDCVYREFSRNALAGTPERAVYDQWEALAQTYLEGLRQLREQATSTIWPAPAYR